MHAWAGIGSATVDKDGLDLAGQLPVTLGSCAHRAQTPGVVARAGQPQDPAQHRQRILARVGGYELIFLADWGIGEKMPMAILGYRVRYAAARFRGAGG